MAQLNECHILACGFCTLTVRNGAVADKLARRNNPQFPFSWNVLA